MLAAVCRCDTTTASSTRRDGDDGHGSGGGVFIGLKAPEQLTNPVSSARSKPCRGDGGVRRGAAAGCHPDRRAEAAGPIHLRGAAGRSLRHREEAVAGGLQRAAGLRQGAGVPRPAGLLPPRYGRG
ncbi:MAG: hypothetical protein WCH79_20535, partial [Planctomycetia bacterium]